MLIEAFVQDIKVQLHMTSEEISSSGSVASIKATVMSLSKSVAPTTKFPSHETDKKQNGQAGYSLPDTMPP